MGGGWITEAGSEGTITIERRDDSWYLIKPNMSGDVKCIVQGDVELDRTHGNYEIQGTVSKYMFGSDGSPDFLFFLTSDSGSIATESKDGPEDTKASPTQNKSTQTYPYRRIIEFTGSGEYVTVEGIVDSIDEVNQDDSNKPKIKGKLRDEKSGLVRTFVVFRDKGHPYLKEGAKFRLTGVRDNYYERTDQEQVVITNRTKFKLLESANKKGDSNKSNKSTKRGGNSKEQIAKFLLQNKDFNKPKGDSRSPVQKAKDRAKAQGRDPAIDHKSE